MEGSICRPRVTVRRAMMADPIPHFGRAHSLCGALDLVIDDWGVGSNVDRALKIKKEIEWAPLVKIGHEPPRMEGGNAKHHEGAKISALDHGGTGQPFTGLPHSHLFPKRPYLC
ncbi:hypothetical protein CRG98_050325 [Punica granatum]|uniref:Uncharacterized protein n=1 Tax=Punica granatum TaxID=22663 RepID=A0A2I0GHE9_PUNGR|nr:hypothetical protein CRG98_050325 [Punica granatum]